MDNIGPGCRVVAIERGSFFDRRDMIGICATNSEHQMNLANALTDMTTSGLTGIAESLDKLTFTG